MSQLAPVLDLEPRYTDRYGRRTRLTPQERRLAESIAAELGVRVADILGQARYPSITYARHHFIAVLRWSTFLSYPEIGALVGGRDHTTIIAAERRYERTLNGEAPAPTPYVWSIRRPGAKTPARFCPLHPHFVAGSKLRFCHWVDPATQKECGARLEDAPAAAPEAAS